MRILVQRSMGLYSSSSGPVTSLIPQQLANFERDRLFTLVFVECRRFELESGFSTERVQYFYDSKLESLSQGDSGGTKESKFDCVRSQETARGDQLKPRPRHMRVATGSVTFQRMVTRTWYICRNLTSASHRMFPKYNPNRLVPILQLLLDFPYCIR